MKYIFFIFLFFMWGQTALADPIVQVAASDTTVRCAESDIIEKLIAWYQNHGGGSAVDNNGGPITYSADKSLEETIATFQDSIVCGVTKAVVVEFLVSDSTGLEVSLGKASFSTYDDINPVISRPPDFRTFRCAEGIPDTLRQWILSKGGAEARDNCNELTWTSFIWNDSEGRSGRGNFDEGPYPNLIGDCHQSIFMTFIVQDACGNRRATTGRFTVNDDTPPILEGVPDTISVACDNIPTPSDYNAYDWCGEDVQITIVDDTISVEQNNCGNTNLDLFRIVQASDFCGNTATDTTYIQVRDDVPPTIVGQDTIQLTCESRIDTAYIEVFDACGSATVTFEDTESTSSCLYSFTRTYTVTDGCDNTSTFVQNIKIEDTSAPQFVEQPRDTVLNCASDGIQAAYESWIAQNLGLETTDGCNEVMLFVAAAGTYDINDKSTFPGSYPATFSGLCDSADGASITLDFVVHDSCGNAEMKTATFRVDDNVAPTILTCLSDITVQTDDAGCSSSLNIESLTYQDSCGSIKEIRLELTEDLMFSVSPEATSFDNLPAGQYDAVISVIDCAGNADKCEFGLTIIDRSKPTFKNCPSDTTIYLQAGQCESTFSLPTDIVVVDACGLPDVSEYTLPLSPQQQLFTFDVASDTTAMAKTIAFVGLDSILFTDKDVQVSVNYTSNLTDSGATISVIGEDNTIIGVLTDGDCSSKSQTFTFPVSDFNQWIADDTLKVTFQPDGVLPCQELQAGNNDGVSKIQATLSYEDASVAYKIDSSTQSTLSKRSTAILSAGTHQVSYMTVNRGGLIDTCTYMVSVLDTIAPQVTCRDTVIQILPDGSGLSLDAQVLALDASDDCSDVSFQTGPLDISCDEIGDTLSINLIVTDESGNTSSCSSDISIIAYELAPTFNAGVCQVDTIQLFANVPDSEVGYTFAWSGPNNFASTLENPFILNADTTSNGTYTLTVSSENGCSSMGQVDINITPLTAPVISTNADTFCLGTDLVLNATTYNGNVTYEWYEGSSSEGTLLSTTDAPSLLIDATEGTHNYYVVVRSQDCASTPSNIISVLAVATPVAAVDTSFITVCEGSSFALSTSVFGSGYTYSWTGPDGYTADKPRPEHIENASSSMAGTYQLVISAGGCMSEPAAINVDILDRPERPVITADDAYCEGSTLSLSVNNVPNGDVYIWLLDSAVYTSDMSNSLVVNNALSNLSGNWQVIIKDGICQSDTSVAKKITIDNLQNVSVTNSGPACNGDSIKLFATFIEGATYSWAGPDGFTSDLQNPTVPGAEGEYTVTIKTGADCETTGSTTVSLADAPVVTALSNNAQSCVNRGDSIVFFPTVVPESENYTYLWTGPNGYTSSEKNAVVINPDDSVNGVYKLIIKNGSCVSDTAISEINLSTLPTIPTITYSSRVCEGSDVFLYTAPYDGDNVSYHWLTPNGETVVTTIAELKIENIMNDDLGEYQVYVQNNDCYSDTSEVVDLVLSDALEAPNFVTNSPICPGGNLVLTATDTIEDAEYIWTGPTGIIGLGQELTLSRVSSAFDGSYRVQVRVGNCSSELSPPQRVVISDDITIPSVGKTAYNICGAKDPFDICIDTTSYDSTMEYVLVTTDGDTIASGRSSCFTISDFSVLGDETTEVNLYGNKDGCEVQATETIRISFSDTPSLQADIQEGDVSACLGEAVMLTAAHSSDEVELTWSSDLSIQQMNEQVIEISDIPAGTHEVVLTYNSSSCQSLSTDTITITVGSTPTAMPDTYESLTRDPIEMDVTANDDISSDVDLSIVTQPSSGTVAIEENKLIFTPAAGISGNIVFTYKVCNIGCDAECSQAEVTLQIGSQNECLTPTIITPNDDGINDAFVVPCLEGNAYPNNKLVIFNQWGDQVYQADRYLNNWKGTHGDKALDAGTYFYVLDLGDGQEPLHSFLIIQK